LDAEEVEAEEKRREEKRREKKRNKNNDKILFVFPSTPEFSCSLVLSTHFFFKNVKNTNGSNQSKFFFSFSSSSSSSF